MSTVDLDDIRERVESHYVGVPPWSAGQDARVLLREVERLRSELAAEQVVSGSMRAAIDAEDAEP